MGELKASRPYMPGYGIAGPDAGPGLLPWEWAQQRLRDSHCYWLGTSWPDGRVHLMPVWAVWDGEQLWFSSSLRSRKVRNLRERPVVTVATEEPHEPVVVEGTAHVETDRKVITKFLTALNAKYGTAYAEDFLDPTLNSTVRVRPRLAFALDEADFTRTPTRWELDG
jgi:PPOX class probable F420-dependent enzyme